MDIEKLMSKHDPILLFASRLLPQTVAADASALYAWCRRLDEITDNPNNRNVTQIQDDLDDWQYRFEKLWNGEPVDNMDAALYECVQRQGGALTKDLFHDMLAGMRSDNVACRRIQNMDELELYAYQVAGTVGLMLLPLLEADIEMAREPAIALGKAIQLINILRDATPDAQLFRIYIPKDLMKANSVTEEDVLALRTSTGYRATVKHVADRANDLLSEAEAGRSTLPGLGPLFIQIIIELYREYLDRLEKLEFNNLIKGKSRVRISTSRKLTATARALGTILSEE